ncbi:MAG TPA: HD family hydrolase [Alphaproteobacteria bacterium]|nr:HD family hydrolase [Alphaproteobacteria bacterium]
MRAWQRMLSGRRLNLLDPSPVDVEIDDIAHGLARVARWNGQTTGDYAFSVAQHSLVVEEMFDAENPGSDTRWRLAALLHDAPEYVIGDMISPFKGAVGDAYKTVERALQGAIHIRFRLPARLPDDVARAIKRADKVAAFSEAVDLAGFTESEARKILGYRRKVRSAPLRPMAPEAAKRAFLARFAELSPS